MSSFISVLSCLILVLASSVFTLPIDHKLSTTTLSSLNNDVTTGHPFNLRLVSDDETTKLSKYSLDKHMTIDMTTSLDNLSAEKALRETRMFDESVTSEQFTSTTTLKPMTQTEEAAVRVFNPTIVTELKREITMNKDEMKVESTSSTIVPELHLSESSTKKYVGLLEDQEEEVVTKKPSKLRTSSSRKTKDETEDKSEATTYPTAMILDQSASKKLSKIPSEYLILDESTNQIVTDHSIILSSTTPKEDKEEKIPLHQGKESTFDKTKKSDN